MITTIRKRGPYWTMATRALGERVRTALPDTVPYQAAHHALLIACWTRKADRFVASALQLQAGRPLPPHVANATEACAALVLAFDGVTACWDSREAALQIRASVPGFLFLVGEASSSHYAARRAEFDELTAMAHEVATWVLDGGPPTSLHRA